MYNWCIENEATLYMSILLSDEVKGLESFKNMEEITLNIGGSSVINLNISDTHIEFDTRFNKVSTRVSVPLGNILLAYPKENTAHGVCFVPDVDNKRLMEQTNGEPTSFSEVKLTNTGTPKSFLKVIK